MPIEPARRARSARSSSASSCTSTSTSMPRSCGRVRRAPRAVASSTRRHDDQDAVGAPGARLAAPGRGRTGSPCAAPAGAHGRARRGEVVRAALERGRVGQHRQAGRAAGLIGAGQRRRVEVGADQALRRARLLDLGDQRRCGPRRCFASIARGEAARRRRRRRARARARRAARAPWRPRSRRACRLRCVRRMSAMVRLRPASSGGVVRDRDEPVERRLRGAVVERLRGQRGAVAQVAGPAGDDQRGGGVEHARCRGRALRAPPSTARSAAALCGRVAALAGRPASARGRPASSGVISKRRIAPSSSAATRVGPGRGHLVEPVGAVHHPDALGCRGCAAPGPAAPARRARRRRAAGARTPAGLDSGPSRLKIVRVPSSTRAGADVAHGGVMRLRHHEADAGLARCSASTRSGGEADRDAERGQHVAGARARRRRAVAVLGDRHAAGRDDERRQGRDVVGARRRRRRCRRRRSRPPAPSTRSILARMAVDRAGDLVDASRRAPAAPSGRRPSAPASPRPTACVEGRLRLGARQGARRSRPWRAAA